MKFPTIEEMAQNVAEKALDEYEYKGRTIRQWIEIIASNDGDTISRKAAIEAVGKLCDECDNSGWCGECRIDHPDKDAIDVLEALPPVMPRTGKWENIVDGIEYSWGTCDTCGARIPMAYEYYEYCPHCGMKNEVEHE